MRILLVEDEQALASVLKRGLQEQGYAVDLANDAEEALAFVSTEPYDVVILGSGIAPLGWTNGLCLQVVIRLRRS